MTRPSWDEYFMGIAFAVSTRADCRRAKHGAIIVKDRRVVSTGYNGSPPDGPSCLKGECPRGLRTDSPRGSIEGYTTFGQQDFSNCVALHAEQNAVAYANRADTQGATLYVTGYQCDMCTKLCRAAGIVRAVWPDGEWNV